MSRRKGSQSQHDTEVKRIANAFKQKGYDVKADVSGFSKPPTIRGYRPDVVASKGEKTKIVEVETPDSQGSGRDKNQQQAFRKEASSSKDITFSRKITK